jgi:hypothetical protein
LYCLSRDPFLISNYFYLSSKIGDKKGVAPPLFIIKIRITRILPPSFALFFRSLKIGDKKKEQVLRREGRTETIKQEGHLR